MWSGAFSTDLTKAGVSDVKWEPLADDDFPFDTYVVDESEVDDAEFASDEFDVESRLEIEDRDPSPDARKSWKDDSFSDTRRGVLWVRFNTRSSYYGFPCDFAAYKQFRASGYTRRWLNEKYRINYIGDWGWPWGREHNVVYSQRYGFFTI